MSLFDIFEGGAKLVGAAVGLKNLFDKPDPYEDSPALRQAEEASLAARRYADAAANPDSPEFKNLATIEEQRIKHDLVTSIEEIMKANRRAAATGRVGFSVNPERRDEFRSQAVARAFADAGERAKRLATDKLMAASNAAMRSAQSFYPQINSQLAYANMGRQRQGDFLEAAQDSIGMVGDIFNLRGNQPSIGQNISWWPNSTPGGSQPANNWAGADPKLSKPDIRRDYNYA